MLLVFWPATLPTTPPSTSTGVTNVLTPLMDRFTTLLSDGWDVVAPWLTLFVVLRLFLWWLSWRADRRSPGGDEW